MKHSSYLIAAMVLVLFTVGQTAQGAVLNSCDQWANYCSGGYCVYNDIWNPVGSWSQCINATSTTQWTVTATHPANGVKSYPNSSREPLNVSLGSISNLTSSVNASSPSSGAWDFAYDIWAPTEVMIWLQWLGGVGPWGSYVTSATIDGRAWDIYKNGYPGYLLQSQVSSGTFNIRAILQDIISRGWLSNSSILANVQCGWEITSASNLTFTMNSYSVSITSSEPIEEPGGPPPASVTPTTGVWYKILNGKSGRCMDVKDNSTSDGATIQQWQDDGGTNQQWQLQDAGSGYYKLINKNSSLCAEVSGWSTSDGGLIIQGAVGDNYQNNEIWSLTKDGSYYQIINKNSSKLIDVQSGSMYNGTPLHQWSYYSTDASSQRWSFQSAGGTTTTAASTTTTAASTTTTAASTTTTAAASTSTTAASTTTTAASTSTTSASTSTTSGSTTTTAASTTTTAATTTTTAAAGCTCDSGCDGTAITPDFTKDGAGQFCWQASSGTYINSWSLNKLEVNNTVYTNLYVFTSSFPAKINGVWYIYYDGSQSGSHFELKN